MEQLEFTDKVAIVTGAGSGIGRAVARAFGAGGASVVIADIDGDAARATARELDAAGTNATAVECDVASAADVRRAIDLVVERYDRLDWAVNNAGIAAPNAPVADIEEDDWARVLAVDLTGVWLCMKYEIPVMLGQGSGVIVNVASGAGLVGVRNIGPYVAAKHGVVGITKTAALEYADRGLRVVAVCPGITRTPLGGSALTPETEQALAARIPRGRIGEVEEIADTVMWLCSDRASYVNGTTIRIDGAAFAGI